MDIFKKEAIYNNIDKHAIVIEDMVRAFYGKIGKTQKYLRSTCILIQQ